MYVHVNLCMFLDIITKIFWGDDPHSFYIFLLFRAKAQNLRMMREAPPPPPPPRCLSDDEVYITP